MIDLKNVPNIIILEILRVKVTFSWKGNKNLVKAGVFCQIDLIIFFNEIEIWVILAYMQEILKKDISGLTCILYESFH